MNLDFLFLFDSVVWCNVEPSSFFELTVPDIDKLLFVSCKNFDTLLCFDDSSSSSSVSESSNRFDLHGLGPSVLSSISCVSSVSLFLTSGFVLNSVSSDWLSSSSSLSTLLFSCNFFVFNSMSSVVVSSFVGLESPSLCNVENCIDFLTDSINEFESTIESPNSSTFSSLSTEPFSSFISLFSSSLSESEKSIPLDSSSFSIGLITATEDSLSSFFDSLNDPFNEDDIFGFWISCWAKSSFLREEKSRPLRSGLFLRELPVSALREDECESDWLNGDFSGDMSGDGVALGVDDCDVKSDVLKRSSLCVCIGGTLGSLLTIISSSSSSSCILSLSLGSSVNVTCFVSDFSGWVSFNPVICAMFWNTLSITGGLNAFFSLLVFVCSSWFVSFLTSSSSSSPYV